MRESAQFAIEDFERQTSAGHLKVTRVIAGTEKRSLRRAIAKHEVVIAPAWVGIDGEARAFGGEMRHVGKAPEFR